jgi:hypothetical protein
MMVSDAFFGGVAVSGAFCFLGSVNWLDNGDGDLRFATLDAPSSKAFHIGTNMRSLLEPKPRRCERRSFLSP